MTTDIVIQAFKCTYIYQIPEEKAILHTDLGTQCQSQEV